MAQSSDDDLNERNNRRVAVEMGVRISTIDPETDPDTGRPYFRTSEEVCGNVSRGGAYVVARETVSPGRRLLLEIDLPDGEHVQTIGRVAWTKTGLAPSGADGRPIGMGIEFLGGSARELRQLEDFLDHHREPSTEAADRSVDPEPVSSHSASSASSARRA